MVLELSETVIWMAVFRYNTTLISSSEFSLQNRAFFRNQNWDLLNLCFIWIILWLPNTQKLVYEWLCHDTMWPWFLLQGFQSNIRCSLGITTGASPIFYFCYDCKTIRNSCLNCCPMSLISCMSGVWFD